MRNKFFFLSILLIFAALMSACVSVPSDKNTTTRTLNVNGNAQVKVTPDVAYISIGAHSENADAKQAVNDNTVKAIAVTDAVKALGVAAEDIQTSNFSIYPQQQYNNDGVMTGVIFVVDNTVSITVRDLNKLGDVLTAAVNVGANNIYGISFDVANKETALSQGRQLAIENARKQADEIAKAAGVTIGEVQSISFYNSYPSTLMEGKGGVALDSSAAVPISAGQMVITVDVNITYEIK